MRRAATWLVVGGVLLVGGVASIATLLQDEDDTADRQKTDPPTTSRGTDLSSRLEAAGARGLLYVGAEEGGECVLRAVRLPSLVVESTFEVTDCRFAVAPDGAVASGSDCSGTSALATFDGAVVDLFDGCAPAWKPDGELTFVRDGEVMTVPRSCTRSIDACAEVALSRKDIRAAFVELGRDPPSREVVREIAWLDDTRLGAVVRRTVGSGGDRRTLDFVVVFEGRAFLGPLEFGNRRLSDLTVNRPARRFFAAGDLIQGVFELDDRGRYVETLTVPQGIPEVSAVAFSPDGTWGAVAGRETVVVFRAGDPPGRAFQLPFEAESLAWRGP
jgi:hypothetical protein